MNESLIFYISTLIICSTTMIALIYRDFTVRKTLDELKYEQKVLNIRINNITEKEIKRRVGNEADKQ
ncbi:hypothetical protein ACGCUP_00960 [Eubacteriales bacterium KG125]